MGDPAAAQGGRDPAAGLTPLEALIAQTRQCCLRPFRFFVSWQGVLTLAYTCVSPSEPAHKPLWHAKSSVLFCFTAALTEQDQRSRHPGLGVA